MPENTGPVNTPTVEELLAEREKTNALIAQLRAEKAAMDRSTFSVSVSAVVNDTDDNGKIRRDKDGKPKTKPGKGGVKVAGLGSRFPVTLYPEQWEIIFANREAIQACYNDPQNKKLIESLRK